MGSSLLRSEQVLGHTMSCAAHLRSNAASFGRPEVEQGNLVCITQEPVALECAVVNSRSVMRTILFARALSPSCPRHATGGPLLLHTVKYSRLEGTYQTSDSGTNSRR